MPPKEKKAKKPKEPPQSMYSAIASYKIEIGNKELSEVKKELDLLAEKNQNLKQRNQRLNQTKENQMKRTLDEYKDYTKRIQTEKRCEKEEVMAEMKDLWNFKQGEEREVSNLKKEIRRTDKETNMAKKELKYWIDFKNKGTFDLKFQKELLEKEISYMKENYEIISSNIQNTLENTIEHIQKNTSETIEKKNRNAAEKAFKELDKKAIEMSHDNEWMKEKISIYRREFAALEEKSLKLEQENVKLIRYLFECNNEELDMVNTQFLDNDNLEENSIMHVDLDQLESVRPRHSIESTLKRITEIDLSDSSSYTRTLAICDGSDQEDDQDNQLKLGKYEYKTLNLNGLKKPIIKPLTPTEEEFKAQDFKGEEWPITQKMLSEALFSDQ